MMDLINYQFEQIMNGFFDGPHATPAPSTKGPIFLGIKNIREQGGIALTDIRHISEQDFLKWTKRVTPCEGDIVFSYEATLHRYAIIPKGFRGCLGRRMALIRLNSEIVDNKFLYYYFLSPYWKAFIEANKISGATVDRISIIDFPYYEINLPSLSKQKSIASILSTYDELIDNNNQRIALLTQMTEEIYKEWFVRLRFPGHEQARIVDGLPEGWKKVPFSELYNTASGGTPSRKKAEYYNGDQPWLKTRELRDDFILQTEETITGRGLEKSAAKLFPPNTVIIAMYGATIGMLGILSKPAATNQACAALLPKEQGFGRAFAFLFMKENRRELITLGQGAAQQNISQVVIKNFPSFRPPVLLVERFSEIVEPLFDELLNLQCKNKILKQTRDLLLPHLISGKLSVEHLLETDN